MLDNFFDSGEVSGDGHVWSNAAIGTDYLEKTWQQNYRGEQRTYDYEGVVADGYPLLQKIPDVNEPASGYLWGDLAAHGKTYYHFGEFISSTFCDQPARCRCHAGRHAGRPELRAQGDCAGRGVARGVGRRREQVAVAHSAARRQHRHQAGAGGPLRAGSAGLQSSWFPTRSGSKSFCATCKQWVADRERGNDTMPDFVMLRLPNDHTAGTRPGGPTPKSSVADNDLAVGRAVEAISHSPYWDDTAFFILEDDAQDGADHVDAHRSIALVISKYSPHGPGGAPFVDSRFYSTVSVIRTMEALLGLPPMNNNDAFCSMISSLFTGPGDQPPYTADYSNRDNGLIYTANPKNAVGARASMKMDFSHADRAPTEKLNVILWKDAMGNAPVPAMLKARAKKSDERRRLGRLHGSLVAEPAVAFSEMHIANIDGIVRRGHQGAIDLLDPQTFRNVRKRGKGTEIRRKWRRWSCQNPARRRCWPCCAPAQPKRANQVRGTHAAGCSEGGGRRPRPRGGFQSTVHRMG